MSLIHHSYGRRAITSKMFSSTQPLAKKKMDYTEKSVNNKTGSWQELPNRYLQTIACYLYFYVCHSWIFCISPLQISFLDKTRWWPSSHKNQFISILLHPAVMRFIDYKKVYDCVSHMKLWNVLRKVGIQEHLIVLMRNPYTGQKGQTTDKPWQNGLTPRLVKEWNNLHSLFILYAEYLLSETS